MYIKVYNHGIYIKNQLLCGYTFKKRMTKYSLKNELHSD